MYSKTGYGGALDSSYSIGEVSEIENQSQAQKFETVLDMLRREWFGADKTQSPTEKCTLSLNKLAKPDNADKTQSPTEKCTLSLNKLAKPDNADETQSSTENCTRRNNDVSDASKQTFRTNIDRQMRKKTGYDACCLVF